MPPGVAPAGCKVEMPLVAIVRFRNGKVAHEHIYRDQAPVLVQIGALEPGGRHVAGAETARKIIDKGQPRNALLRVWAGSEGMSL
jgi:carboxymethylenebutenolidase